jgi:hypothetical protein
LDERDAARIVENQLSGLKIDAVLDEVALVLFLVPFEANHTYVHISTYRDALSRPQPLAGYDAERRTGWITRLRQGVSQISTPSAYNEHMKISRRSMLTGGW